MQATRTERADAGAADRFYNELPPFRDFSRFVDFAAYQPTPDDWVVMITDVRGSTQAIEEGRYKDVNMVGAASITAVLNICGEIEAPFVFGGDGGAVVVPHSLRDAASEALLGLQAMSEATFGLFLRVGAIPVRDLRAKGVDVRIRKYELSEGNNLAMFAGGGIELCDRLLKDEEAGAPYRLDPRPGEGAPDLQGLSCRWEPLTPRHGRMITLMVQSTDEDQVKAGGRLDEVLKAIADILGERVQDAAPASEHSLRFSWPPKGLGLEARATAGKRAVFWRYLTILTSSLIQLWCERFNSRAGPYDAPSYREELRANTDFRKFDGTLRMVLDVSVGQAGLIERYLEREHERGRLVYGAHLADAALMTCLVFSLEGSKHVHFIDGSNGGFAKASQAFKTRLEARRRDLF